MAIIAAHNLGKKYTYKKEIKHSLRDFSLSITSPQIYGLVGPNGAGKTTFIKTCLGLIRASSGELKILDSDPYKQSRNYLSQISSISGNNTTFEDRLSARELMRLQGALYGLSPQHTANKSDELVDLFDIKSIYDTPLQNLSLGQKMQFEIIFKILHEPKLIYMDEPTLGLDFDAQHTLHEIILKLHHEQQTTILLTSHYLPDIEKLCSKFTVIEDGTDIFAGSFEELKKKEKTKGYLSTLIKELNK